MQLRINEVAEQQGVNLSRLQRQTGLTMTKLRRYWYNETKSAELETLETLVRFFRRYDPEITVGDLFTVTTDAAPINPTAAPHSQSPAPGHSTRQIHP